MFHQLDVDDAISITKFANYIQNTYSADPVIGILINCAEIKYEVIISVLFDLFIIFLYWQISKTHIFFSY